jgi:hypothetical protein
LPEPVAPARSSGRKVAAGGWVDEGPVELTDPGRVALEVAEDEPSPAAGGAIVRNDQSVRPAAQTGRTDRREQPPDPEAASSDQDEAFWEDDLNRAAARGSNGPADQRGPRAPDEVRTPVRSRKKRPGRSDQRRATPPTAARGQIALAPPVAKHDLRSDRKKRSWLRVLLIVVPLLVVTTVAWRYRRNVRKEYPLKAELGWSEGIPALENGDFDKAHQLLAAAKTAVDALGGAVEHADEIRNAAAEAALFVDQTRRLDEMLEEAGRTDPEVWASRFETLYKGRAVWFDSAIYDKVEDGGSTRYILEYMIFPPGESGNFADRRNGRPRRYALVDLAGFQLFELARPGVGDHVTFAARLASFKYDAEHDVWWVGLDPKSGVFITHTKALEAGWPRGADAEAPVESRP